MYSFGNRAILFQELWQFAGFARDLKNPGDYVVAPIGGKSVLVQNFDGELKAFLNVCSHRFSAIRRDCKGNGPLQCQYHGWVYDRSGIPTGIASIKEFDDITDARRQELALESWDVDRCGELVFVRLKSRRGPALREWLGGAWERTESIASSLGELLDCNRLVINANWKVAVENTLESYHVKSVHPETFARLNATTAEFLFDEPHSGWRAAIDAGMEKQLRKITRMIGLQSQFEGYFHQLLFPALTLATTVGLSYAVQYFRPLTAQTTEFTSYVFAARHDGSDNQRQLLQEACKPAVDFNRAVFEEDRVVCGQVQIGIEQAPNSLVGELSNEEQRVFDFQRAWRTRMNQIAGTAAGS